MATLTKVILTEAEPIKQTTERDFSYFSDGRLFQINVASLDSAGEVVANTGQLNGRWKGYGAGIWDSFDAPYELDGSTADVGKTSGGWEQTALGAEIFEFDGTGSIPAGGSIEISIRDWNQ